MAMNTRDEQSDSFLNSDTIRDEFFIGIVEKKLKISRDEFKLRLVLLSPATGKNENYVSVLYRAKVKIEMLETKERKAVDVIIKALLTTMPEMKEFSVFPRERFVYEDILASFEKIWLDRAGVEIKFGPRSILFETDPYEIIVLDDLKAEQYEMLDRKAGLNMAQAKMLLTKLANFHAASTIRYQKDGTVRDYFDRKKSMPPMTDDSPFATGFLRIFKGFVEAVKAYGDCDEYLEKISNWEGMKVLTTFVDVAEPMRSGFHVMNHGDIWLNNMMFKSDADGNPLDVSMIDYQGSFWGTPSADLLYFLFTSVADDIKVSRFDELVGFYHSELVSGLKKLRYDQHIPTLTELHIDILDRGSFACSCIMFVMFIVKNDSPEEMTLDQLMGGNDNPEMLHRVYHNETYKKALKTWFPFMNKRGFLDTMMKKQEITATEVKNEE